MISAGKFFTLCHLAKDRFWPKVDMSAGPTGCWPWVGANDGRGYGKFKIASHESARAHRVAYVLEYGPISEGSGVLHRCDQPPCCNPAHLFTGDHNINMRDMAAKGRSKGGGLPGEKSHAAKLTAAQVAEIKELITGGEGNTAIARRYGIGQSLISRIRRGQAWGTQPLTERYASSRRGSLTR